jgi:two-component system phosphate regulon response regulator PhoB
VSENFLLIVEDELEIAELIEFHARRDGFETKIVHSGRTALEVIGRDRPDLVILDLMLPDVDGLEVLRRVRRLEEGSDTPILVVSAKGDESDVVAGIELGADDYVTKPFSPRILMARIRNLLRRKDPKMDAGKDDPDSFTLCGGMLVIDLGRHVVTINNQPIILTLTEFGMLQYLAARPGFVRTREQMISAVHGRSTVLSSRTVDVHVTALRRKLEEFGDRIQTVRGVGYRFAETAERTLGD